VLQLHLEVLDLRNTWQEADVTKGRLSCLHRDIHIHVNSKDIFIQSCLTGRLASAFQQLVIYRTDLCQYKFLQKQGHRKVSRFEHIFEETVSMQCGRFSKKFPMVCVPLSVHRSLLMTAF